MPSAFSLLECETAESGFAMGTLWIPCQVLLLALLASGVAAVSPTDASTLYRGKFIGSLTARAHKVSGEVYAVDGKTLHIRNFVYSGSGPDAFFWVGFTEHPSPQGIIVPNEKGTKDVLGAYNMQDITLTLPGGLTLKDIKWFGVWCRAYEVNFGDLYIPADLDFPQPHVIGSLSGQHAVSSGPIVIIDSSTILVPDFSYDGQGPSVHFWVGKGKPGPEGHKLADETGSEAPLKKSDKKTMVLSLPAGLTIFDIDYLSIWCELYFVDFGHVKIPRNLNVPPSLQMLGVTPQTKLNCEVLQDDQALEIRWAIAGDSIVMQLVGRIEEGQYISFGLSGDESRSAMIGGDVVVAWIDKVSGKGNIVDYYLDSKSQCSGRRGSCPDSRIQAETNNVRLLSATVVNGFTFLTFQRPLKAHDDLDKTIYTNASQSVIWAVGPINQRNEASYHTQRNRDDLFIDFGRVPKWNCPAPEPEPKNSLSPAAAEQPKEKPGVFIQLTSEPRPVEVGVPMPQPSKAAPLKEPSSSGWQIPPIKCNEPSDGVFYAQIGPTGGKRGFSSITGQVGWGIAWYINGLLVPEVYLVRGKTYTFVVEGGDNAEIPAKYHPFYITDDSEGGYQHKSEADRRKVKVFAGVGIDSTGKTYPTGTGRSCQWQETNGQPADSFVSYGAYQRSLSLQCDAGGHPGIVHWKPDENTPDLVYYHCFTHRYLGWKIHIVDHCSEGEDAADSAALGGGDQEPSESITQERGPAKAPLPLKQGVSSDAAEPTATLQDSTTKSKLTGMEPVADKSQLNEKQEALHAYLPFPQTGQPHIQSQDAYLRPQHTILIPQTSYVRVPTEAAAQQLPPGLFHSSNFGNVQYPYEGQLIRKEGTPAYALTEAYYSGPTRTPIVAHPLRPSIVYSSTVPPQLLSNARIQQSRIQEAPQLPLVGLTRDTRLRPQSRNLPKREQLEAETLLSSEELQMGLKSLNIKDPSSVEIIKINDTDRLPFQLPSELVSQEPRSPASLPTSQPSALHQAAIKYNQADASQRRSSPHHVSLTNGEPIGHSFEFQPRSHYEAPSSRLRNAATHHHRSQTTSPGSEKPLLPGISSPQLPQQPVKSRQSGLTMNGSPAQRPFPYNEMRRSNSDSHSSRVDQTTASETQRTAFSLRSGNHAESGPKLEIIPNNDVTMVYVKGTDEKGLQRELPRILEQLGKEAEIGVQSPTRARRPLQRRAESGNEAPQLPRQQDYQVSQPRTKAQNNTDLHILTDIWSIINEDEGKVARPAQGGREGAYGGRVQGAPHPSRTSGRGEERGQEAESSRGSSWELEKGLEKAGGGAARP